MRCAAPQGGYSDTNKVARVSAVPTLVTLSLHNLGRQVLCVPPSMLCWACFPGVSPSPSCQKSRGPVRPVLRGLDPHPLLIQDTSCGGGRAGRRRAGDGHAGGQQGIWQPGQELSLVCRAGPHVPPGAHR